MLCLGWSTCLTLEGWEGLGVEGLCRQWRGITSLLWPWDNWGFGLSCQHLWAVTWAQLLLGLSEEVFGVGLRKSRWKCVCVCIFSCFRFLCHGNILYHLHLYCQCWGAGWGIFLRLFICSLNQSCIRMGKWKVGWMRKFCTPLVCSRQVKERFEYATYAH